MIHTRTTAVAFALLVAVTGVLMSPVGNTLAAREGTGSADLLSGTYNLIIGAGEIGGTNGNDLIIGSAGADEIDGSIGAEEYSPGRRP